MAPEGNQLLANELRTDFGFSDRMVPSVLLLHFIILIIVLVFISIIILLLVILLRLLLLVLGLGFRV